MKLVIGIVRPEKANDVLESLYRAEVRGVSLSRVQGHGGELDRVETYRGTTVKMGLADKVRFEIAVSDPFVQPTIDALCEGARTGEVGDGKIFVVPLDRVVRIQQFEADRREEVLARLREELGPEALAAAMAQGATRLAPSPTPRADLGAGRT